MTLVRATGLVKWHGVCFATDDNIVYFDGKSISRNDAFTRFIAFTLDSKVADAEGDN